MFFQILIIISGNLSFLNWLTIIPSLAGLDDAFCDHYLWFLFTKRERKYLYDECAGYYLEYQRHQKEIASRRSRIVKESTSRCSRCCGCVEIFSFDHLLYKLICLAVGILIGSLSVPVVQNLLSSQQIMNTSFDRFRIVNTYGAFGTVGKERFEVIFAMTSDEYIDDETVWTEIEFKCKPGAVGRRPCLITPYHYRLDWQIWFAGFRPHSPNRHSWIFLFVAQILMEDKSTIGLLDESVARYMERNNVSFIKADMFKYEFTKKWSDTDWWTRELQGTYLPPLDLKNKQFQDVLKQLSWTGNKYDAAALKSNRKKSKKKRKRKREL